MLIPIFCIILSEAMFSLAQPASIFKISVYEKINSTTALAASVVIPRPQYSGKMKYPSPAVLGFIEASKTVKPIEPINYLVSFDIITK